MKELTAKEIYDIIREKPYKDGEQMIKDYARRYVKKGIDVQWKLWVAYEKLYKDYFDQMPRIKFE